ncbi:Holliday junction resolvase RuvX [Tessaracoccus caeni]|uniref:Holliday junction resolvase RuvX n=1 Tax=Tessaracoccus caeni TaxID=3031239 RepID=UPI0023DAB005|nr:Holliday junction resolvase RuvX [Tessaracoccus caeni]MDF1490286.1 Holliday junction resolvase RuvX [Tessaracoccus caeni]
MADGSRLAIDWGKARIGVAASHSGTSFAYPVETVAAGSDEMRRLTELISQIGPRVVYVGYPLTLSGEKAIAAGFVAGKARRLASRIVPVPVYLVDERLSTASASRSLGAAGRGSRSQRSVIDQAAAVEILQRALDIEERTGSPAGQPIETEES